MRMLRLTRVLASAASLLGVLSACQRDQTARVESPEPHRAVVAAEDTAIQPLDTVAAAPRVTWHRLARRTNGRAPLVRYTAVRRSATPGDTAAPPPAEAHLLDLTLKASEFFRIDPTQAAEVRGREGTLLRFAANSLVDDRQQAVTSPVWVELKECYSLSDLLLSNCVSMNALGEPLQTSGMLLVRASTARGQKLHLASGSALELVVPRERRHPGLQLYHSPGRQPRRWATVPLPAPASETVYAEAVPASSTPESTAVDAPTAQPIATAEQTAPPAEPGSVFNSTQLGWLTCLRPWRPAAQTTALTVSAEVDPHTTVRLVFPDARVILEGEPQADGYAFAPVPVQQRAVLVGLRYLNGSPYVALSEVMPGAEPPKPLEFRETTLAEVEQLLERLN